MTARRRGRGGRLAGIRRMAAAVLRVLSGLGDGIRQWDPNLNRVLGALLVYFILVRVSFGLAASKIMWFFSPGDTGKWVAIGDRMLKGEVPFRDFADFYGPLVYYWSTFWYWLFGGDIFAAVLQLEVISPLACLLLAWFVSFQAFRNPLARIVFLAAVGWLELDRNHWAPALRVWLPLTAVAFSARAMIDGRLGRFAAGCFMCGLCLFVSIESAVAGFGACGVLACAGVFMTVRGRFLWLIGLLCGLVPPAAAALLFPDIAVSYFVFSWRLAMNMNWYAGVPFPLFSISREGYMFHAPIAAVVLALFASTAAVFFPGNSKPRRLAFIALGVFAAIMLRSLLGRSDVYHLAYVLAAVLPLWVGLFLEEGFLRPGRGLLLLALSLLPFSGLKSEMKALRDSLHGKPGSNLAGMAEIVGDRVKMDPFMARRMAGLAAAVSEMSSRGEPVLFLPVQLGAHFARLSAASPVIFAESIMALRGGAPLVIESLEKVNLVVYDPASLAPAGGIDGLQEFVPEDVNSWRLSWFSPADEVITRELRDYLAANFEFAVENAGVVFLKRRREPVESREYTVRRIELSGALMKRINEGRECALTFPATLCDQVRIFVACDYGWGRGSLAKTCLEISWSDANGRIRSGVLPVPPARLSRDLRFRTGGSPVSFLRIRISAPGAFNPRPRVVKSVSVEFVSIPQSRK